MRPKPSTVISLALLSLFLLAGCSESHHHVEDTPEAREAEAQTFARLSIEGGSLDRALDKGASLGEAYSLETIKLELGRELSEEERATVRRIMRDALAESITPELWTETLVEVCVEFFTTSELHDLNHFFQSPTGAKFLDIESELSEAVNERADAVFTANIDGFIERVDDELARAFPELAEEEGQ